MAANTDWRTARDKQVAWLINEQAATTRLRSVYALAKQAMPHENVAIRATQLVELLEAIDDLWESYTGGGGALVETIEVAARVHAILKGDVDG